MGKLIDLVSALFVYFCVATVLTAGIAVMILTLQGYLTQEKVERIVAVMHGAPLQSDTPGTDDIPDEPSSRSSVDETNQQRSVQNLDLALREQAVEKGLDRMRQLRNLVDNANERYDIKRDAFLKRLEQMKLETEEEGIVKLGEQIKNMKPAQQKAIIQKIITSGQSDGLEDAVAIVKAMPAEQQKKLHKEFNTDDRKDIDALFSILREIRKGKPESSFIEDAKAEFSDVGAG